jgi:hypothetical protein
MATVRNLAISLLRLAGVENIAAATRYLGRHVERPRTTGASQAALGRGAWSRTPAPAALNWSAPFAQPAGVSPAAVEPARRRPPRVPPGLCPSPRFRI